MYKEKDFQIYDLKFLTCIIQYNLPFILIHAFYACVSRVESYDDKKII